MEFFESSGNLTEAIGKTLVHSLWIGLLFLSILKIGILAIPSRLSISRYRFAIISLLLFAVSMVILFLGIYTPEKAYPAKITASHQYPGLISFLSELNNNGGGSMVGLISTISSYFYFTGFLFMLLKSFFSYMKIRGLKKMGTPIQGEWFQQFLQLKNSIGINRKVELLESFRISTPALIGLLKPVILVPSGMFTHLSLAQVETILMHELFHLRRLDFLVNILQIVMENLFFYNPAVWSISQIIRTEREHCCDDRVLQTCSDPITYARALYQLADPPQNLNKLAPGALGTNKYQLINRIKRILNQTTMKTNIREKLFSLALMAGSLVILLTISGFSSGLSIIKHIDSKQVLNYPVLTSQNLEDPLPVLIPDTIPNSTFETPQKADPIDLEKEIEAAKIEAIEAIEEVDLEVIKMEMEIAAQEALESIDWEELKRDMEIAEHQALESINWEELMKEVEAARLESLESINWDEIQKEMAESRIHLDSIMKDFDFDFDFDIDMEDFRVEMQEALNEVEEIDWEEIRNEIENMRIQLDSVLHTN